MCSGGRASCPPQAPSSVGAAWALGGRFPKWRKYVGDSGASSRDPLPPAENPLSLWGSGWGLSAPKDTGRGRGGDTSSARAPATIFLTILILSSLLLLLSHLFLISSLCLCCSLRTLFICSLVFRQWRFYAITDLDKTAFPFLCVMNSAPVHAVWLEKCSCFQCCQILCLSKLIKNIL